jgi:hypothetical protein
MNRLIFSIEPDSTSDDQIKKVCLVADPISAAIVFADNEFNSIASVELSILDAKKLAKTILDYYG